MLYLWLVVLPEKLVAAAVEELQTAEKPSFGLEQGVVDLGAQDAVRGANQDETVADRDADIDRGTVGVVVAVVGEVAAVELAAQEPQQVGAANVRPWPQNSFPWVCLRPQELQQQELQQQEEGLELVQA